MSAQTTPCTSRWSNDGFAYRSIPNIWRVPRIRTTLLGVRPSIPRNDAGALVSHILPSARVVAINTAAHRNLEPISVDASEKGRELFHHNA